MNNTDKVLEFIKSNNGTITGEEAQSISVGRYVLQRMVTRGMLEKVARGFYIDPNVFEDEMYLLQYRFKKGIFSYQTALYLHGLTDRTPNVYEMSFPRNYRSNNLKKKNVKAYYPSQKYYELGIEEVVSPGQHKIYTYNKEKTLCDILNPRSRVESEVISQAFNVYIRSKNRNIKQLVEYAEILNVSKDVDKYLEVLM